MTTYKDLFSKLARGYAQFRPSYPDELFSFLAERSSPCRLAWDCATGSGQAAIKLAPHFAKVIATDASAQQLNEAPADPKIEYRQATAENSGLASNSVDLITVAQAFHWFNAPQFYTEADRVLRPGGVIAIWCYPLCQITPAIDQIVDELCYQKLDRYWEPERKLVENRYRDVVPPFEPIQHPKFLMHAQWSLDHLLGYLATWSAARKYISEMGSDPFADAIEPLKAAWGKTATRPVTWEMGIKMGRKAAKK